MGGISFGWMSRAGLLEILEADRLRKGRPQAAGAPALTFIPGQEEGRFPGPEMSSGCDVEASMVFSNAREQVGAGGMHHALQDLKRLLPRVERVGIAPRNRYP